MDPCDLPAQLSASARLSLRAVSELVGGQLRLRGPGRSERRAAVRGLDGELGASRSDDQVLAARERSHAASVDRNRGLDRNDPGQAVSAAGVYSRSCPAASSALIGPPRLVQRLKSLRPVLFDPGFDRTNSRRWAGLHGSPQARMSRTTFPWTS